MSQSVFQPREILLDIYFAALGAVNGRNTVRRYLRRYPVSSSEMNLVAIGKAAASMAQGALDALGGVITRGLVVTKEGHCDYTLPFECLQAAHPVPDESSLVAGAQVLQFIASAPEKAQLLFLISGGASSLVEVLPEGLELDDLRRVNHWLLGSGLDISVMNAVRKRLSCIKGGRLAGKLGGRRVLNLMISDVAGDRSAIIGSGLLVRGEVNYLSWNRFPDWLRILLQRIPAVPEVDPACFYSIDNEIIANNRQAKDVAAEAGRRAGFPVYQDFEPFYGDALKIAARFARRVLDGPAGLYIGGGESTMILPPSPGRGGRNQSLALAAARILAGSDSIFFLAAGTDGTDGPTKDAGALVDGGTLMRGESEGLDAGDCLNRADAGTFLDASGDLVHTGPTGTNVMDLLLVLKI